jgi:hypothetical protein
MIEPIRGTPFCPWTSVCTDLARRAPIAAKRVGGKRYINFNILTTGDLKMAIENHSIL